jgi:hypothetical protein
MEDNNSTLARQAREPDCSSSPWVDTVIATHGVQKKRQARYRGTASLGRINRGLYAHAAVFLRLDLTQTGNIVRHRFDFTVIELGCHLVHL